MTNRPTSKSQFPLSATLLVTSSSRSITTCFPNASQAAKQRASVERQKYDGNLSLSLRISQTTESAKISSAAEDRVTFRGSSRDARCGCRTPSPLTPAALAARALGLNCGRASCPTRRSLRRGGVPGSALETPPTEPPSSALQRRIPEERT